MRARYYSPEMRRFVNADIVPGTISNAITLNRFAYANGNPVSFVDPFGLSAERTGSSESEHKANGIEQVLDYFVKLYEEYGRDPFNKYILEPVSAFFDALREDIKNYDKYNESEQKVLESKIFSSYKGAFVLRLPFKDCAFSYGIIFLGQNFFEHDTVRHEYGHTVQFDKMGLYEFTTNVAIPSLTGFVLDTKKSLPYDYFTAPWEAEADYYGEVENPRKNENPWSPEIGYYDLLDLIYAITH